MRAIVLLGLSALGAALSTGARAAEEEQLDEAQAVGVALMANASEVPIATSVAARTTDPQVRAYAQELVQAHAQADQELLELLEKQDMSAKDSPLREEIADKAGKDLGAYWSKDVGVKLDQRFMTDTIASHRDLLETYDQTLIPAAKTPAVARALTKQRASVEQHLNEACTIGMKMDAQTAGCPEAERGTK